MLKKTDGHKFDNPLFDRGVFIKRSKFDVAAYQAATQEHGSLDEALRLYERNRVRTNLHYDITKKPLPTLNMTLSQTSLMWGVRNLQPNDIYGNNIGIVFQVPYKEGITRQAYGENSAMLGAHNVKGLVLTQDTECQMITAEVTTFSCRNGNIAFASAHYKIKKTYLQNIVTTCICRTIW